MLIKVLSIFTGTDKRSACSHNTSFPSFEFNTKVLENFIFEIVSKNQLVNIVSHFLFKNVNEGKSYFRFQSSCNLKLYHIVALYKFSRELFLKNSQLQKLSSFIVPTRKK